MADYTLAQIHAMQEDAANRVREMNRRSKNTLSKSNSAMAMHKNDDKQPQNQRNNGHENKTPAVTQNNQAVTHKSPLSFLKSLDLRQLISGGEQSMLLLLIMILLTDSEGDDFLIYALIYIML